MTPVKRGAHLCDGGRGMVRALAFTRHSPLVERQHSKHLTLWLIALLFFA